MEYFKILQLSREPFSNSPDPRFFYKSDQHVACLQKIELALRLRRGLNVVLGKVGTGKTTLCRRMMTHFGEDEAIDLHFIFDPSFAAPRDFLLSVAQLFKCDSAAPDAAEERIKEQIKHHLFRKGLEEGKTVVLVIDEGQKIPPFCLEILREFLNFETNDAKLLQIVIFAQTEFQDLLDAFPNFSDRVNLALRLGPLSFKDTRHMILFRLNKASERGKAGIRITYPAMRTIYRTTGGYPRQIVHLCHRIILTLIVQNKRKAALSLVRSCIDHRKNRGKRIGWKWGVAATALIVSAGIVIGHRMAPILSRNPAADFFPDKVFVGKIPSSGSLSVKPGSFLSSEIGRIGVGPLDKASAMVAQVYGEFTENRMTKVAEANPHIPDIHRAKTGQIIVFPVLSVAKAEDSWKGKIIRIMKTCALEEAYRFVRESGEIEPDLRVLPTWSAEEGTVYQVVLSQCYPDEESARSALEELPSEISGRAEVLDDLAPGSLVLAP